MSDGLNQLILLLPKQTDTSKPESHREQKSTCRPFVFPVDLICAADRVAVHAASVNSRSNAGTEREVPAADTLESEHSFIIPMK